MKVKKVIGRSLLVLLCIVVVIAIIGIAQFHHRSNPKNLKQYETNNPFITGETAISAHRSGAGEFPEETLAAFRGCAENPDVQVDYFEFDLHMTADDVLVLSHDSTLDRVSDAVTVFGAENVLVRDKTLAELKDLNIAAQFVNDAGETPYTDLHGDAVPDELRILSLDEVLDYLTSAGDYRYIIEIKDGGEVKQKLSERALGRVLLYPVYDPATGDLLYPENTLIDEPVAKTLDDKGINSVMIRSALTCQSERGICSLCYGRDLARRHLVNIGETVGIIAAQSIGEPGTQLTMRTFHIGGTASKEIERSNFEAQHDGRVVLTRVKEIRNREGVAQVLGKSGQVAVIDEQGREVERYTLPNGARLHVTDGQSVSNGQLLAEWDPFNEPFVSEVDGFIKFTDLVDGKTYQEKLDEATHQASMTIIEYRTTSFRPSVSVCDENGDPKLRGAGQLPAVYSLPVGAIIMVKDGEQVLAGDIIARKPRETSKTRDIVGGLPRVAELFEVRKPKDMAVVSEIAGTVSFAGEAKGKRKLIVTPEVGESKEYLVPKGKHITVSDGDFVECGDLLTEGNPELHDILRTKGEKYLAAYLVDEIQEVYRFQGVGIDDKHIEVIVRQMLRKVTVTEPGGTSFLVGEQVDKAEFKAENQKAMAEGRSPATAEPLVLGITQASLTTSSFISAASFQETTKVLTEAALKGKMDYLRGLKENVIVGRLIPAGTGYREYVDQDITVPDQKERPDRFLDELSGNPIIADLD